MEEKTDNLVTTEKVATSSIWKVGDINTDEEHEEEEFDEVNIAKKVKRMKVSKMRNIK